MVTYVYCFYESLQQVNPTRLRQILRTESPSFPISHMKIVKSRAGKQYIGALKEYAKEVVKLKSETKI